MNITKSKIALTLSGLLFLSVPLSSAFAAENHCEMSATMMSMKSELVGYVKGVKDDDTNKMHQHINELLLLSEKSKSEIPANIKGMDHSKMDMKDMPSMDHSKMDHGDMNMDSAGHDMASMPTMEGMTNEQHHQHMMHMQSMTGLNDLFKQLNETKDKEEIKLLLGKVKAHSKKNKLFSKDCH